MATSLPKVHIPVAVTTEDVDKGLSAAERKIRNSAARMKRLGIEGGGAPSMGSGISLKASQGTALLGGLGKLGPLSGALGGLGAAGMALSAPLALFGIAQQQVQMLASLTKGATEALDQFKATGEQTFAANSAILARLAGAESGAQAAAKVPGFFDAMTIASQRPGETSTFEALSSFASEAGAFIGALSSGKGFNQAILEAQMMTASEAQSKTIADEIKKIEQARMMGNEQMSIVDWFNVTKILDKAAQELGKS